MLRSFQASETGPLEPCTQKPSQREVGTFLADGFITQKASQTHHSVLGFWGSGVRQLSRPLLSMEPQLYFRISWCWCFCGRAELRPAPDKTPPTLFPVSDRLVSDEFHSQHSCPQASEGRGHRARSQWELGSISHSALSHWKMAGVSSPHCQEGGLQEATGRGRCKGHLLG